jgi:RNA polymerase sigma-70 factor (ECF subfamily)
MLTAQAETLTDEQVVERVVQGDTALFEILMRRNNTRIYRTVRAVLRDETEVEDAMQAAYLLAYSSLRSFRGGARFSTWLTRIALNEALGRVRREQRAPTHPDRMQEAAMSFASEPPTPELQAQRREMATVVERAVDELPEIYRVVFILREVDGMDTAETAAALDLGEDAVKTRLSRARAALRDSLDRMVGSAAVEAFGFHAVRCDRVVAQVMRQIAKGSN